MRRVVYGLVLAAAACGGSSFDSTVQAKLMQAVQTKPQRIDMGEYVTSEWDRVCVLTAGTTRQQFEQVLGSEWPDFKAPDAEHVTLVFVNDGRVAESTKLERRRGDFAAAGSSYCLPRDSAVFHVTNTEAAEYRPIAPLR